MSSFGKNLRRLRLRRNMKQEDLAGQMHVSRQTVSGWETGRRQPDLDTVIRLAEVLDVEIHELIFGSKPNEYTKYQRRFVFRAIVYGATVTGLSLFHLLLLPHLKKLFAAYHLGLGYYICLEVMPLVRSFSLGALIPALLKLFVPVCLNKRQVYCLLILGIAALLPALLYWLGVLPLTSKILYTVGHAFITYILPFVSGICIESGISSKKN